MGVLRLDGGCSSMVAVPRWGCFARGRVRAGSAWAAVGVLRERCRGRFRSGGHPNSGISRRSWPPKPPTQGTRLSPENPSQTALWLAAGGSNRAVVGRGPMLLGSRLGVVSRTCARTGGRPGLGWALGVGAGGGGGHAGRHCSFGGAWGSTCGSVLDRSLRSRLLASTVGVPSRGTIGRGDSDRVTSRHLLPPSSGRRTTDDGRRTTDDG